MIFNGVVGIITGGVEAAISSLSPTLIAGTKALIHMGMQAGASVLISTSAYIGQNILSGNDITLYGLSTSVISGFISGLTYKLPFLWIIKLDDKIPKKRMMYLLALRIIYTSLGSILFIVNAFVFINEIIISCLLVITVASIYISICLFTQLLKSKNRDVFLSGYIKTDNENIDEDLDLKEENEFYKK